MPRVFSGIQPTGDPHIGNYIGAIKNWVALQDQYECTFCVVDYHAITVPQDPDDLARRVKEVLAWNLASGIDPERATLFVQSDVPEHTELTWILGCLTPIGSLERMTQFKDKSEHNRGSISLGLLSYPVLMAADILIYKADVVPVGEDQLQHLELAREIARKFNNAYGETFPEPKGLLTKTPRIAALNDPTRKMSKSIPGSYIAMSDTADAVRSKVSRAVTDVGPRGEEMSPGVKNLFDILTAVAPATLVEEFLAAYAQATLKYSDLKGAVTEHLVATLTPIQERYNALINDDARLAEIAAEGARKARRVAGEVVAEVREKTGFGRLGKK